MVRDDVRARRAERVKADRFKSFLPQYGKYILIAVVAIAIIAAAATLYHPPLPKKFAHEHPSFAIFVENEPVSFLHADYDLTCGKAAWTRVHMHTANQATGCSVTGPQQASTWHVEASFPGGVPDVPLDDVFGQMKMTFRKGYLKLDTLGGHNGSEFADQGNHTWRVFVAPLRENGGTRGPWVELAPGSELLPAGSARDSGDYSKYIPLGPSDGTPGDKILVTYGDLTPEQVAAQQDQVPEARA